MDTDKRMIKARVEAGRWRLEGVNGKKRISAILSTIKIHF